MIEIDIEKINEQIERISRIKEALELLERIWICVGPYDEKKALEFDEKLIYKLRDFSILMIQNRFRSGDYNFPTQFFWRI